MAGSTTTTTPAAKRHSLHEFPIAWTEIDGDDDDGDDAPPAIASPLLGGDVDLERQTSITTRISRFTRLRHDVICFYFTISYVFGAGILSLPFAFAHGGLVASSVVVVAITAMSTTAGAWLTSVCARAEAIIRPPGKIDSRSQKLHVNCTRQFEIGELFQIFYGKAWKEVWDVALLLYCMGGNWLFASIFANSVSASVLGHGTCDFSGGGFAWHMSSPCRNAYWASLALLAVIEAALVSFDLKDAWVVTVPLVFASVCVALLMFFTVTAAIRGWFLDEIHAEEPSYTYYHDCHAGQPIRAGNPPPYTCDVPLWLNIHGLASNLSTFVFAQLFQHGTPALLNLSGHKRRTPEIFVAALSSTCVLYIAIGVSCALYFGREAVPKMLTSAWVDYGTTPVQRMVAHVCVVYPAISVIPGLSVQVVTIANAWAERAPWRWMWRSSTTGEERSDDNKEVWGYVLLRYVFVAIACGLAAITNDVHNITNITGMLGFLIMLIAPCMLEISSRRQVLHGTVFDRRITSSPYVVLGITLFVLIPTTLWGMFL